MRLILASQSPRRRQLMEEAGYEFGIVVADESAENGLCSGESARDMVARFGRQKAEDVAARVGEGIVIGCDTVAELHGQILGKPRDVDHAQHAEDDTEDASNHPSDDARLLPSGTYGFLRLCHALPVSLLFATCPLPTR